MTDSKHCSDHNEYNEDDPAVLRNLGFLFEGLHPTTAKRFVWENPFDEGKSRSDDCAPDTESAGTMVLVNEHTHDDDHATETERRPIGDYLTVLRNDNPTSATLAFNEGTPEDVFAVVRCIDDDPGALGSGHYVWPAALVLCDYLVARYYEHFRHRSNDRFHRIEAVRSILELGAGSGIPSIVASQVFGGIAHDDHDEAHVLIVVTDSDHSTLKLARANHERTAMETKRRRPGTSLVTVGGPSTSSVSGARTVFCDLTWGCESEWRKLAFACRTHRRRHEAGEEEPRPEPPPRDTVTPFFFDLVLGSDLIDCAGAVEPLFRTIDAALGEERDLPGSVGRRCLLSQSFGYDAATEAEIDRMCEALRLRQRDVLRPSGAEPAGFGGSPDNLPIRDSDWVAAGTKIRKIRELRRLP